MPAPETATAGHVGKGLVQRLADEVVEIYIFTVRAGRLASAVGVEDNLSRARQLGLCIGVGDPLVDG
jgi:hypothetical protein